MSVISNLDSGSASTENNDANNDDETGDFDFYPNQTSDLYLTVGDGWATQGAIMDALGLERPDISVSNLTRGDLDIVMKKAEREDWSPMQTLWVVTGAIKGWLGDRQRHGNEDFGVGLDYNDDGEIEGFYDGGYADAFGETLPTIEFDGLTNDEKKDLKAIGVDYDDLGYHPDDGPRLPFIGHERLPVAVETMEDVEAVVEQFEALPEEPTLGNTANDADVPEEDAEPTPLGSPEEFTVAELEEFIDENELGATDLAAMKAHERDGKERVTAIEAIEAAEEALDEADDEDDARSRYAKAEAGTLSESEGEDAPEVDADDAKGKAEAVVTLLEAGYDRDEAAEMVYGE